VGSSASYKPLRLTPRTVASLNGCSGPWGALKSFEDILDMKYFSYNTTNKMFPDIY
jgi:hypothetical protein